MKSEPIKSYKYNEVHRSTLLTSFGGIVMSDLTNATVVARRYPESDQLADLLFRRNGHEIVVPGVQSVQLGDELRTITAQIEVNNFTATDRSSEEYEEIQQEEEQSREQDVKDGIVEQNRQIQSDLDEARAKLSRQDELVSSILNSAERERPDSSIIDFVQRSFQGRLFKRNNKGWDEREDVLFEHLLEQNLTKGAVAVRLQRAPNSVYSHAEDKSDFGNEVAFNHSGTEWADEEEQIAHLGRDGSFPEWDEDALAFALGRTTNAVIDKIGRTIGYANHNQPWTSADEEALLDLVSDFEDKNERPSWEQIGMKIDRKPAACATKFYTEFN